MLLDKRAEYVTANCGNAGLRDAGNPSSNPAPEARLTDLRGILCDRLLEIRDLGCRDTKPHDRFG